MPAVRRVLLLAVLAVLAVLAAAVPAAPAGAQSSSFTQLTGHDGCTVQALPADFYYDDEDRLDKRCTEGHGLLQAEGVAVAPDGRNVYAAAAGTPRAGSNAVVTFTRDAATGRLSETGCVSDDGGDGRVGSDGLCTDGDGLSGADDVVVSPDGRNVYASTGSSNGVVWFDRDPDTGALTQRGCIKEIPRGRACVPATGLLGASGVAIAPDGLDVYVSAAQSDAVTTFQRDPQTGALNPMQCVSATGTDGACVDGTALQGASSVAVSPDGRFVYVTAREISAITTYARDATTGTLTPAGCILADAPKGGACTDATGLGGAASVALSPDGRSVYVAAGGQDAVVTFSRDAASGALAQQDCIVNEWPQGEDAVYPDDDEEADDDTDAEDTGEDAEAAQADGLTGCGTARAIDGVDEIAVAPDGRTVFTAASNELTAFERDPDTGALTEFGCAQDDPTYKSCSTADGLYGASGLASAADGRALYVASRNSHAVSVFGAAVAITTRAARVRAGTARIRLACPATRGARGCRGRLRMAQTARRPAYRVEAGAARTYTVRLPAAVRRTLRRHGTRVTVRATDGRRVTRATARRLILRR